MGEKKELGHNLRQKELWRKFVDNCYNEGISECRLKKLHTMFAIIERCGDFDFEKATRIDIEKFVTDLHRDKFTTKLGKKFSGVTKADIKKFLKQFYKWLRGEGEYYPKEVSWIKTKIRKEERSKEKPVLSIKEVKQFANAFNKSDYKILVLLLFDSGFRIQEMQSVRKKDLTWEDFDEGKKCFWIKCNKSKTLTRKIPVTLFTEDLRLFLNSSNVEEMEDDELLFSMSYGNLSRLFKQASEKIFGKDDDGKLKKNVTPHALRHSSATYYSLAYDGNMNAIAQRYGWGLSSKELATYIRKSGAYQKQGAKKIFQNELMKVKEELARQKEAMDELRKLFMEEIKNQQK